MRLLIFYGIYEGEKAIAHLSLGQALDILKDHQVDVLVLDDASKSHVGQQLVDHFKGSKSRFELLRLEQTVGHRGYVERVFGALKHIAQLNQTYDYVLRLDADLHFCRRDIAELFAPGRLPALGIVGQPMQMRRRDFVQIFSDLLPAGLQRRRLANRHIEHGWALTRARPVWWADIGVRALAHGFRGTIVPGSFILMAWPTLQAMKARGWLDRDFSQLGLVFGDDTMVTVATVALGHPVTDVKTLLPDWSCELFLQPQTTAEAVKKAGHYFIHPLKAVPWAEALRKALPLADGTG